MLLMTNLYLIPGDLEADFQNRTDGQAIYCILQQHASTYATNNMLIS